MPSHTVENYLKQIYLQQQKLEGGLVPMGRLATAMKVTPGTATSMMKTLAEARLVDYEPRGGVRLRKAGLRLAIQVLRRHRLIELFLVKVLHLDWSQVHEEAEELEHAISEKVLEHIDKHLGYPQTDPHGDPIPQADGSNIAPMPNHLSLADCPANQPAHITRVLDQDPNFLQFIHQQGLIPGAECIVEQHNAEADAVRIRPGKGSTVTLGTAAASKILIQYACRP